MKKRILIRRASKRLTDAAVRRLAEDVLDWDLDTMQINFGIEKDPDDTNENVRMAARDPKAYAEAIFGKEV